MIKTKVVELNLFESELSWDDQRRRRDEIISTRIYLGLLVFAVLILTMYTVATVQTQSFTVKSPSQSAFERLATNPRSSGALDCPCQNISIPYDAFILISLQYHQLCSSDFIVQNSLWINLVNYRLSPVDYSYDDYRLFLVPHFRLLSYLCTLANETLVDALFTFRSSTLISKRAQSRQAVETQMRDALNQFRSSILSTFRRMLDFIREMGQGNGLVSSISSNWFVLPLNNDEYYGIMEVRSYGDMNCSCGTNSMCVSSTTIDQWNVPGFLVGCYPLESLLQSTLECLYDVTCINELKNVNQSPDVTIRPLNSTLSSPNATVQSLIDVLMVDQWESSVNHNNYYAACATLSCSYVVTEEANIIYMITSIIALCGGLTVVLKVLVPFLLKIAQYMILCRRQRIDPVVTVISDHD